MLFNRSFLRVLWIAVLVVSIFLVLNLFRIESSLLKLLPKYQSENTNSLVAKATESINKQLVLMAVAKNKNVLLSEFEKQLKTLENKDYIAHVEYQVNQQRIQNIFQNLIAYKDNLLSHQDLKVLSSQVGFEYIVFQAQEFLYGVQQLNKSQLELDPLFLFQKYITLLSQLNMMEFDLDSAYFMVEKEGVVHMSAFIELTDSAFLPGNQFNVINALDEVKNKLEMADIQLYSFGAVRFAQQAFQGAKNEISTVGLGSLLGVVILLLLVFRSLTPLLLSVTSIGLGLMFSMAVCLLVFKQIHAFALVFGATIAGVSIDYCFHYLVEASFSKSSNENNKVSFNLRQIMPGLVIGFLSSAMVYLGFLITGYEVLGQISLFSVLGLFAVLINVLIFFPWIHQAKAFSNHIFLLKVSDAMLHNPIQAMMRRPWLVIMLLVMGVTANYFVIKPNDDVRALQHLSSELKHEEAYIRDTLSWHGNRYFVLIRDKSLDGMLQQEADILEFIRVENDGLVGVSDFIPSKKRQLNNYQWQQKIYNSDVIKMYLRDLQISHSEAAEFQAIDLNILANTELKMLFKQRLLGEVNGLHALIIPFNNRVDLPPDTQAILIQQAEDTSQLFAEFRIKSSWVLSFAVLILVVVLGLFRYPWLQTIHLVALPLLSGFIALLVAGVLGLHISLFSILALLLVLGMGLDYVVFLKESHSPEHVMVALLLSSLTTILAFGLLAFSEVPVLNSFGFMVGFGIALVLVMSPAVVDWNKQREECEK